MNLNNCYFDLVKVLSDIKYLHRIHWLCSTQDLITRDKIFCKKKVTEHQNKGKENRTKNFIGIVKNLVMVEISKFFRGKSCHNKNPRRKSITKGL